MRVLIRSFAQVVAAVALFLVTRTFLVEMFNIPTPSMQGTLLVGDFLVVDKLRYGAAVPFTNYRLPAIRSPKRGDIIVFRWPQNTDINFVKRVVGVPGDTLLMRNGELIRNNIRLDEPYVSHLSPDTDPSTDAFGWQKDYLVASLHASQSSYWATRNNWGPLIVPKSEYFVLGDNRDNSLDSRYWGFVPDSLVRGTPLFVYFSCVPDSVSRLSCLTHARWSRFGTIVR